MIAVLACSLEELILIGKSDGYHWVPRFLVLCDFIVAWTERCQHSVWYTQPRQISQISQQSPLFGQYLLRCDVLLRSAPELPPTLKSRTSNLESHLPTVQPVQRKSNRLHGPATQHSRSSNEVLIQPIYPLIALSQFRWSVLIPSKQTTFLSRLEASYLQKTRFLLCSNLQFSVLEILVF